jgi:hypothetical protein
MLLPSTFEFPNELDVERLLCDLTIEEKVALTAGKRDDFPSSIREAQSRIEADIIP